MATTTYLSNLSALTVNSVSLVDQCTGIVFTQLREALDKTTLADTGRTYTGGLYNNECTMTLFQSYAASETYQTLASIVGRLIDQEGEAVTSIIPKVSIVNPNDEIVIAKSWLQDTTVEDDGSFIIERVPIGAEIALKSAFHPGFKMIDIGSSDAGMIRTLEVGHLRPGEVFDVGEVFVKRETIPGFEKEKIDWDATLSGQVTNESGDVMVGFDVEISYDYKMFREVTDIKGLYKFVGLPRDKKVKLMVSGRTPQHSKTGRRNYRDSFEVICDGNDFNIQLPDK